MKAVLLFAIASAVTLATPADAQRPVREPQVQRRLPAPRDVRVEQVGDDELLLTWTPVPGARGYHLGRAVGNEGYRRLLDPPEHRGSSYRDGALRNGVPVRYTITPIDSQGVAGIRATSEQFQTWRPAGSGGRPGSGGTPGGTANPPTTTDTTTAPAADTASPGTTATGGTSPSGSAAPPPPGPVEVSVAGSTVFASWPAIAQADTYDIRMTEVIQVQRTAEQRGPVRSKRIARPEAAFTDVPAGTYSIQVFAENFPDPTRRSKDDRMWRTGRSAEVRIRVVPSAPGDSTADSAGTRPQVPVRVEHLPRVQLGRGQVRDLRLAPAGGELASLNTSVAMVDEATGAVIGRNAGWTTLVWTKLEDAGVWIRIIEVEVSGP